MRIIAEIELAVESPPQTPLGKLTALPRPLDSCFWTSHRYFKNCLPFVTKSWILACDLDMCSFWENYNKIQRLGMGVTSLEWVTSSVFLAQNLVFLEMKYWELQIYKLIHHNDHNIIESLYIIYIIIPISYLYIESFFWQ